MDELVNEDFSFLEPDLIYGDDGVGDEDDYLDIMDQHGNYRNRLEEDYPSLYHLRDGWIDDGHHAPQYDSYGRNLDDMR